MTKKSHEADVAFIKELAQLLQDNDLTEIEVLRDYAEGNSLNVRVSKASQVVHSATVAAAPAPDPAAAAPAPAAEPAAPAASDDPAQHPGAITSPMVGTVYLQPEPGAPSFIKTGDIVSEGQTLLIIEAMKTMNHIPAPRSGKVARILIDDGSPVEYGAPLVILE